MPDQIRGACLDLLSWMKGADPQQLKWLTPVDLEKAVESEISEVEFLAAVTLLTSSDFAVLEMGGYINDPEDGLIVLEGDDLEQVLMDDTLVHPTTGEVISHGQRHVHLFYAIRDEALD